MKRVHRVMDPELGDRTTMFDASTRGGLARAEAEFNRLTVLGFSAFEKTGDSLPCKVKAFSPTQEEVLFVPHLVGG
jgi:hypothetical protein